MSTKSEAQEYRLDPIKWLLAIVLVVAGVVANSHYSAEPLLYRVLAGVVLAGVVGLIVDNTATGASIWRLLRESLVEVRKVVLPTRTETNQPTLIDILVLIVMDFILWLLGSLF